MADILAIVSRAVFERDARVNGKAVAPGIVWPVDRYNSNSKPLQPLSAGGRIFLVTVRPPAEELWFLGVVDSPSFDGSAWVSRTPNTLAVTNISALRKTIRFESGKGMSQDKGTLGMSLQTPRGLTASDAAQILALVGGTLTTPAAGKAPQTAPPARVIGGKYEVLRQLGVGGMGVVYEARHTGTGRRVAVKEIVDEALRDSQLVERFQREARVTGTVETQHIAPVLDSGTDPATKHPYLVMELLQGEDLQQLLVRQGPLPEDVALRIVGQACLGLARAHEAGVVHRDIKPANLFLARRDGGEVVVKLLDFGIARVREELKSAESHALTSTGLMLGTPLYMSPEQVMGPKKVDHRTDLWSLGVVLHEALSGATPHGDAETLGALLVAICAKPARPVREAAPHVRPSVAAIVHKALALDPSRRYASAAELLADLKTELAGVTLALHETMFPPLPAAEPAPSEQAAVESKSVIELAATSATPQPRDGS